jgi:hypothetical protein
MLKLAFHDTVRVPEEAAEGKVKITLSIPESKEFKAAPATFELPFARR